MARINELSHLKIPLENIKLATNNFSDGNFIGEGGFGRVYKGQLRHESTYTTTYTTVAVKRLDVQAGGQGKKEFLTEIVMLASYKHNNLASLVGFCDEGGEKIIIYKHEARGSLDKYLASDLTWVQRLQICLDAARGLNYLHTGVGVGHRLLHRDVKSSNVLLNQNWEAKISDFGLSKIGPTNQNFSFLVTNAVGTSGYVDPLYESTGVLRKESDVYSFGVVLFEVLCGRLALNVRCNDERRFLSRLVKHRYEEGRLDEIILPSIRKQMKPSSLHTFSKIAYQCLNEEAQQDRPNMALIIKQLQISLDYQMGRLRMTELWGSNTGGYAWSLHLHNNQKLRKITIDHTDCIYALQFTTEDSRGTLHLSQQYGGGGGNSGRTSEVIFDIDEEITGIRIGLTNDKDFDLFAWMLSKQKEDVISSIYFMTNKKSHGPFGEEPRSCYSLLWDAGSFAGFFGRAGFYLDGLGCYLKATI